MKRYLLALLCLLVAQIASAQPDSVYVWNKWCARKDTALLFALGNNTIQIYSPGFSPADIKVKSLDNTLRIGNPEIKKDTLSVLAMPYPAKGKRMRLAILNKKTSKQIKVIDFACDSIPKPVAQIGNLKHKEAKQKDLLAQTTVKVSFPNSLYSYPYTISQYTFKITHSKGGATIPVRGIFIPRTVLQAIKDAPPGTAAMFTDIKATCPECATRTLDDVNITIK
jgi:GldM C-terminal domain